MWKAIWSTTTGQLLSVGTVVADPLPEGVSVSEVGDERPQGNWNASTRAFDPIPETLDAVDPVEFMRRFTLEEEAAIRIAARTDVMVEIFLARVMRVTMVHLSHPETVEGVAYLLNVGLLTPERAEEIQHG